MKIIFSNTANVKEQPEVDIENWAIYEVKLEEKVQHFLIGFVIITKKWRVTTAIQYFDSKNNKITTSSGRVYNLMGQPINRQNMELELSWRAWKMINNISADLDVTNQYFFLH